MSLEQELKLMKKYDFSKFSSNLPDGKTYPHGLGGVVSTITAISGNVMEEKYTPSEFRKSMEHLYASYGYIRCIYDYINSKEIKGKEQFNLQRKVRRLLPKLGRTICELTIAVARSGFEFNDEVREVGKILGTIAEKLNELDYDSYRKLIREFEEQLKTEPT